MRYHAPGRVDVARAPPDKRPLCWSSLLSTFVVAPTYVFTGSSMVAKQ